MKTTIVKIMAELLKPKVIVKQFWCLSYQEMLRATRLTKKPKKYGFTDVAVYIEEVVVPLPCNVKETRISCGRSTTRKLKPGTYYNIRLEYIV